MLLKQENAAENPAAVIGDIVKLFRAVKLPLMADERLYLGMPHPLLLGFHQALHKQYSEDEEKRYRNRLRYAGICKERTDNTFKWDDNTYPLAEPGLIEEILTIEFVRQPRNLVILGPPGVGKSLLSTIVACKAVRAGCSVKYKTAHNVITELREARAGNSLSGYVKKLQACDLLVMEDITFATPEIKTAQAFYSIFEGRYGLKSTLVTFNEDIKKWAAAFPNQTMCSAILGRIYQEAIFLNMNGAEDVRFKRAKSSLAPGAFAGGWEMGAASDGKSAKEGDTNG
jgi:DNA replication protein DnaC